MDNKRKSLLFQKFMESKCTDIKTRIDSLLEELCNQLSHSIIQGMNEQVCNQHRNSALLESESAKQACPNQSDHTNHIDSVHIKAPLVGRKDFETGQKCFNSESTAVKKDADLNYSRDDQQYENAHLQFNTVEDQDINISLEKVQTRPEFKENDLLNNDSYNNLIVQNRQNDRVQDLLEFPKKFELYDKDLIKNYRGKNKDQIRNQNKDESNVEKIREYQESNKDKVSNLRNKDYKESKQDYIRNNQNRNRDKLYEKKQSRHKYLNFQSRIQIMYLENKSVKEIASKLNATNINSIQNIIAKIKSGKIDIHKVQLSKKFKHFSNIELDYIKKWISSESNSSISVVKWRDRINQFQGTNYSISTINRLLRQLDFHKEIESKEDNLNKEYQETNKDKLRNQHKDYQEFNIRKVYSEAKIEN